MYLFNINAWDMGINKGVLRYGFGAAFFLGLYFLLMEAWGLNDVLWLRFFNLFIVGYAVNACVVYQMERGHWGYVHNFMNGFTTAVFAVVISVLGLLTYVFLFKSPQYFSQLAPTVFLMDGQVVWWKFCLGLIFEGVSSSVILSFVVMQRWKNVYTHSGLNRHFFQLD